VPVAVEIVVEPISLEDVRRMAREQFGDFVKAVVDVGRAMMAIGGELHADEEAACWSTVRAKPICGASTSTRIRLVRIASSSIR
jgi:uncharacterized protein DUF5674